MVGSLLLMCVLGVQSCGAVAGGAIVSGLGTTRSEMETGDSLAGAGGLGILAAFLWLVGAALVLAKPRVSMWLFAASVPLCAIGGLLGFDDLYIWAVFGIVFALGSWRGIPEKERELEQQAAQRQAALTASQAGWHADPWRVGRLRYHDGREWTAHTTD